MTEHDRRSFFKRVSAGLSGQADASSPPVKSQTSRGTEPPLQKDASWQQRMLPPVQQGDLLAVFSSGAYAMSMSSQYNSRPRACEVLVSGARHRLIRARETYEDLVAGEASLPEEWE